MFEDIKEGIKNGDFTNDETLEFFQLAFEAINKDCKPCYGFESVKDVKNALANSIKIIKKKKKKGKHQFYEKVVKNQVNIILAKLNAIPQNVTSLVEDSTAESIYSRKALCCLLFVCAL